MEHDRSDAFPEAALFFSPNWYSHQIASLNDKGLLALGSNDEVILIDIQTRRFVTSLYSNIIKHQKMIDSVSERKVTAVLCTLNFVVFTGNSGSLSIFQINDRSINCKYSDILLDSMQVSLIKNLSTKEEELELLLVYEKSSLIYLNYKDGILNQINTEKQDGVFSVRILEVIVHQEEQYILRILENGLLSIWTKYMDVLVFSMEIGGLLNTVSMQKAGNILEIVALTRRNRLIHFKLNLYQIFEEREMTSEFVACSSANYQLVISTELEVQGDEQKGLKQTETRLRFSTRAVSLPFHRILFTARDGKLYCASNDALQRFKEDKLIIKPPTYELEDSPYYTMLDENCHFQNVFFSQVFRDKLIVLGMDRVITIWNNSEAGVNLDFSIKCLSKKITQLAIAKGNTQSVALIGGENTIQLWNIEKSFDCFKSAILWRGLEQKYPRRIIFQEDDTGMAAIIGRGCVFMMNVYSHEIPAEFKIEIIRDEDVLFSQWMCREEAGILVALEIEQAVEDLCNNVGAFKSFSNAKLTNAKAIYNLYLPKFSFHKNKLLVLFFHQIGFMIIDFALGCIFHVPMLLSIFTSAIEVVKLIDSKRVLIIVGDRKGNLILLRNINGKATWHVFNNFHSSRITSIKHRIAKGEAETKDIIIATSSYDKLLVVSRIANFGSSNQLSQNMLARVMVCKQKLKIKGIEWHPSIQSLILIYFKQNSTVQICNIDEVEENEIFLSNVRGHKGYINQAIWNPMHSKQIITCSDDQSVKIWNIDKVKNSQLMICKNQSAKINDNTNEVTRTGIGSIFTFIKEKIFSSVRNSDKLSSDDSHQDSDELVD